MIIHLIIQTIPTRPVWIRSGGQNGAGRPTYAVCAVTRATICGIKAEALEVLDEDREAACFVEKCAACLSAIRARGRG